MDAHLYHHGCKVDKLGLGTDCSGGYSPSMINSMRFAVATSNNVAIAKTSDNFLNYKVNCVNFIIVNKKRLISTPHFLKKEAIFYFY